MTFYIKLSYTLPTDWGRSRVRILGWKLLPPKGWGGVPRAWLPVPQGPGPVSALRVARTPPVSGTASGSCPQKVPWRGSVPCPRVSSVVTAGVTRPTISGRSPWPRQDRVCGDIWPEMKGQRCERRPCPAHARRDGAAGRGQAAERGGRRQGAAGAAGRGRPVAPRSWAAAGPADNRAKASGRTVAGARRLQALERKGARATGHTPCALRHY